MHLLTPSQAELLQQVKAAIESAQQPKGEPRS